MGWFGLFVGVLLLAAGLWNCIGGGWRLRLAGAMQASLGAAILLENGPPWLRYTAWGITIVLTLIAYATTSLEVFRRTRLELGLAASVIVLIWVIQLVPMPRGAVLALLVVLLVLSAAFLIISLGRAFGLIREARRGSERAGGV